MGVIEAGDGPEAGGERDQRGAAAIERQVVVARDAAHLAQRLETMGKENNLAGAAGAFAELQAALSQVEAVLDTLTAE